MKKNLLISIWFTLVTTVLLGIGYPLVVTGLGAAALSQAGQRGIDPSEREARRIAPDRPAVHSAGIFLFPAVGGRRGRIRSHCVGRLESRPTNKS